MKRTFFIHTKFAGHSVYTNDNYSLLLPALSIFVGVIAALFALLSAPDEAIKGFGDAIILDDLEASLLSAYWNCSRYHIFTALFSTSFLGVVLIPALLLYRGFALCCTSAALILDHASTGAMLSAIILGLPGIITLPCLLMISSYSMQASAQLLNQCFGLRQRYPVRSDVRRVCLCFICLIPVAVLETHITPKLISFII